MTSHVIETAEPQNRSVQETFLGADELASQGAFDRDAFYQRYSRARGPLCYETKHGGRCETIVAEAGLLMAVADIPDAEPMAARVSGQGVIEFHHRLSGTINLQGEWGSVSVDKPSLLFWHVPEGCDVSEVSAVGGGQERWVSLYCDPAWLIASFPDATSLEDMLKGGSERPSYAVMPSKPNEMHILEAILANPFSGSLRTSFARAKAMELLCHSIDRIARQCDPQPSPSLRVTARDRKNVMEAKVILGTEFMSPPTLTNIARRVGLSPKKLGILFSMTCGETLWEYLRRIRIETAKRLLATTDLQVGQVAYEVGYKHHSTFTVAFIEQVGMSPKAYSVRHRQLNSPDLMAEPVAETTPLPRPDNLDAR